MKKRIFIKYALIFGIIFFIVDFIYRTYNNINYLTREKCFLYQNLPKPVFLFFEYFIELFLLILLGVFFAVLLEKFYLKYNKFYPKNPLQAFIYGSLIPICSCGAIPLLSAFKDKVKLRTVITFIIAAPLLSPSTLMLSLNVLGLKFTLLRVISSFILAIGTGFIVDYLVSKKKFIIPDFYTCKLFLKEKDVYIKTYHVLKQLFPYFLIAGTLGITFELFSVQDLLTHIDISNPYLGAFFSILAGIPIYLCNGADVLTLRPFIEHLNIPMGTAMGFSLTSTAICITAIVLLVKYLGKKMTYLIISIIFILTFILSLLINLLQF